MVRLEKSELAFPQTRDFGIRSTYQHRIIDNVPMHFTPSGREPADGKRQWHISYTESRLQLSTTRKPSSTLVATRRTKVDQLLLGCVLVCVFCCFFHRACTCVVLWERFHTSLACCEEHVGYVVLLGEGACDRGRRKRQTTILTCRRQ